MQGTTFASPGAAAGRRWRWLALTSCQRRRCRYLVALAAGRARAQRCRSHWRRGVASVIHRSPTLPPPTAVIDSWQTTAERVATPHALSDHDGTAQHPRRKQAAARLWPLLAVPMSTRCSTWKRRVWCDGGRIVCVPPLPFTAASVSASATASGARARASEVCETNCAENEVLWPTELRYYTTRWHNTQNTLVRPERTWLSQG